VEPLAVEGIVATFGFHPERIEAHRSEVLVFLSEVSPDFLSTGGGGMSFLNLCMDRHGHQWGEHRNMEQLVCLPIGLKLGSYLMPRDLWSAFPGGMPYVCFTLQEAA